MAAAHLTRPSRRIAQGEGWAASHMGLYGPCAWAAPLLGLGFEGEGRVAHGPPWPILLGRRPLLLLSWRGG